MWFGKSEKEMEFVHQERMKCLETGFPLPDAELAWVEAVRLRGSQVTAVLIVGTIALACAPVGSTTILLVLGKELLGPWLTPALIFLVWAVCGYLLYTLLRQGMQMLSQTKRPPDFVFRPMPQQANGVKPPPSEPSEKRSTSEAVQEGWYARPENK